MIGYLSGKVLTTIQNQVILKLPNGVGYLIHVSPNTKYMQNENLELFILQINREDKEELYGFNNVQDREWVEKLTKVSGVGPKMAATIIYSLGWEKVIEAIQESNPDVLTDVKGLGSKTAKKIVLEMKGDLVNLDKLESSVDKNSQMSISFTDTLSTLGYKRGEIVSIISALKKAGKWNEEELGETVKEGLKLLSKK